MTNTSKHSGVYWTRPRHFIWLLAIAGIALLSLARVVQTLLSIQESTIIAHWNDWSHPLSEALPTLFVIAAWILFGYYLSSNIRKNGRIQSLTAQPQTLVFSGIGLGVMLLLACALTSGSGLMHDKIVLWSPFVLIVGTIVARGRRLGSTCKLTSSDCKEGLLIQLAALASISFLFFLLLDTIFFLAFLRPPPSGDELSFWWSALESLHRLGFTTHMSEFHTPEYTPAYPLISQFLLIPTVGWGEFTSKARAIPFLWGFTALWILMGRVVQERRVGSLTAVFYISTAIALLFNHAWIHQMFFRLWYGEAMATIVFALFLIQLFKLYDHASDNLPWLVYLTLLGLAAIAVLTKPPLSFLFLGAILPTLAFVVLILNPVWKTKKIFVIGVLFAFFGGSLTQQFWLMLLASLGKEAFYSPSVLEILTFNDFDTLTSLTSYFLFNYKTVWMFYILTSVMALICDWRRYLPFWLVTNGTIASVFILYAGYWHDIEYESGARYILHGAYGWIFFALYTMYPEISNTLQTPSRVMGETAFT